MKIGLYLDEISLQLLKRGSFVSCEPIERIEQFSPGLPQERMSEIGQTYLVADMQKQPLLKAKLVDAFVTYFGDPDPCLTEMIGYGDDVEKFQNEYADFYEKQFPDFELDDATELFVTIYELVQDN